MTTTAVTDHVRNDMTERIEALLAGVAALSATAEHDRLDAGAVNRLGAALGLDGPGVLAAVEALKAEGMIDLHWGPALSLTAKGRRRAAGESDAGVTVHAGGTYVAGNVGDGANVGTGAGAVQSTVAIGSVVGGVPIGLLAAALTLLQERNASMPEEARAPAEELEQALKETAAAASDTDSKDRATAATALTRVSEGLRRSTELLEQVEQAGGKLANVGGMLKSAWNAVAQHLGM